MMDTYEITYKDGMTSIKPGRSASGAKYEAFLDADTGASFREFIGWIKGVRRVNPPKGAYECINRYYSKSFEVGQRVVVPAIGTSAEVRGKLLWPTCNSNYLNIFIDGREVSGLFHPGEVLIEDSTPQPTDGKEL